ncbi:MAG: 3-hydroxy-2-methylbutyryl-CoA dehydrogenase [Myxococcaceae bacterium]|nr:3-hydroxy-2-methylbutyryl-CoA dehydrogenase [Myxococcaceae bacterium]
MQIEGSSALVSGGASGLGEAVVRKLVASGAHVVIADVQRGRGEALAEELGSAARFALCDVTQEDQVESALQQAVALAPLRAVVSCAGIAIAKRTLDKQGAAHDLAAFQRVFSINVTGTFNLARLGAARMVASTDLHAGQRGVIVNTASIAAFDAQMGQVAYGASKGAIVAMTLPLARDLAAHAIRVCTLCPGIMDTPLLAGLPEAARAALALAIPHPSRLGLPSEFAALVQHVIENDYLNGESIRLDGALRMSAR